MAGRNRALGVVFAIVWALVGGCGVEDGDTQDFFEGEPQSVDQRRVQKMPVALDSVDVAAHNVFNPEVVFADQENVYMDHYDGSGAKVLVLDRKSLTPEGTIGRGAGQGPGEVQKADVAVANGRVAIYSENQQKIAVYDTSGTWVTDVQPDISPSRATPLASRIIVMSTNTVVKQDARPPLFRVINMNGTEVERFGPAGKASSTQSDNPLAYIGTITTGPENEHLFYGGYPEPLLKKYKIGGKQVFSVKTIDNIPSEINYITFGDENTQGWRFSDHAVYSVETLSVYDDYLLVAPRSDMDGNVLTYIDIYNIKDGSYIKSFQTQNWISAMAIEAKRIYTAEIINEKTYLKAYPNILRQESE